MKRFFTMMFLATIANAMMSQGSQKVIISEGSGKVNLDATLPDFSYNGQVQMFIKGEAYDGSSVNFVFYDDDFSLQRTLTVTSDAYDYSYKTEEREWINDGNGNSGYLGEWQVSEENGTSYKSIERLSFKDFDQSCDGYRDIYLTQTLFNKDDKYEYLLLIRTLYSVNDERDRDEDGQIDYRQTNTYSEITGFKIMSETGAILQTVTFDNGFCAYGTSRGELLKINGKFYLHFFGYVDDGSGSENADLFYTIDSNTSSIRMKTMNIVPSSSRYTLDGRRTNGERGINIIRTEDGAVKKVIVK